MFWLTSVIKGIWGWRVPFSLLIRQFEVYMINRIEIALELGGGGEGKTPNSCSHL